MADWTLIALAAQHLSPDLDTRRIIFSGIAGGDKPAIERGRKSEIDGIERPCF
jgi:hypothetical protein